MTSEELADQVTKCVESLRLRILGVGNEQYSNGDEQKIESKSNKDLIKETLDELDDGLIYLAILRTRVANLLPKIRNDES